MHYIRSLSTNQSPMINPTEHDEREYLESTKEKLTLAVKRVDDTVRQYAEELKQKKQYIHEHQSGMDEADMVASEQSINRMAFTGESAVNQRRKLLKLMSSPYFGRIDFTPAGGERAAVYIGVHTFSDGGSNIVYDWRAPISSIFYDYELGAAAYRTPGGDIQGNVDLKRQYRILDGRMEYMIENGVNIHDEVLQRELSKSADDKMKNIVATIQRDQNAVIRNETAPVMIIQGVAGSGKTSIALHRIAFLLYRYREEIKARNVLIISPNKVFADYISHVLPELGEEHIPEMVMEELATEWLENKYRFQSFFQQVSQLLEKNDPAFIERIQFKATFEFLKKLNQYIIHIENNYFTFTELQVGKTVVPFPFILERFKKYHRIPLLKRFPEVANDVRNFVREATRQKLSGRDKEKIAEAIPRMFRFTNVFDLYRDFYQWLKRPEMLQVSPNGELEYADVFPLIYFRIRLEGIAPYEHVKHLLVDEMQDYTPVQYSVLSRLFHCKKTILGDVSQRVNPYSASSSDTIEQVFPQADTVKLFRSYRSTWEITAFAQNISRNPDIIPMERHGEAPQVLGFSSHAEELDAIRKLIAQFKTSGYQSMGIICKTHRQAQALHKEIKDLHVHLLTADSTAFKEGIILTTAHLAKGLEFDEVIVPFTSSKNYQSDVDRSMLYIACTRAMHRLSLTYVDAVTTFVNDRP
jgi:DNA helicase-2/ATP-dependent DNA helicase PcrA